jgi:hypothetical protein
VAGLLASTSIITLGQPAVYPHRSQPHLPAAEAAAAASCRPRQCILFRLAFRPVGLTTAATCTYYPRHIIPLANNAFRDNANGRIFSYQAPDNQNLTVELCVSQCDKLGYSISGVEYGSCHRMLLVEVHLAHVLSGVQCFCGNSLVNGAALATSGCNSTCLHRALPLSWLNFTLHSGLRRQLDVRFRLLNPSARSCVS